MSTKNKRVASPKSSQTEPATSWSRRLLWIGGVVIGLGLIILLAVSLVSEEFVTGVPEGTEQVPVESAEHVEGEIYEDDEVPAGGEHSSIWQNCGFYDTPIQAENAVHALEHGAVWLTYLPDLPQDQIDILAGFTNGAAKVLVSPVSGQDSPIIATAWGNQLSLGDASDSRLEQFVNEFRTSPSGPEPGGRCDGGVGNPS